MSGSQQLLLGGKKAADAVYVEDVFSTYLYTGNGSTQTITNGIDLAGKGGLVWLKLRSLGNFGHIYDTVRGTNKVLYPSASNAQGTSVGGVTAFNSNGFSIGDNSEINPSTQTLVSWTFRKQPKFFDCVTYTGTGANRTIAHNLGSVPGCIIVKRTDVAAEWQVYHRSIANTEYLVLNSTAAKATGATRWNSTTPNSTTFRLGTDTTVNANGGTYVAYLYAHNAGGFGASGTDNVISCGSYTGNGSTTGPVIDLGYEPQWLMIKNASGTGNWQIIDNMRGMPVGSADATLQANLTNAESSVDYVSPTSTGFQVVSTSTEVNTNGSTYIYIAIRRGPMKVPTSGTSVFAPKVRTGTASNITVGNFGFPIDLVTSLFRAYPEDVWFDRLRGATKQIKSTETSAESTQAASIYGFDVMDGYKVGIDNVTNMTNGNTSAFGYVNYAFRRAPGFMDVVCYTGNSVATRDLNHNLQAIPTFLITKNRSAAGNWAVACEFTGLPGYYITSGDSGGIALNTNREFISAATSPFTTATLFRPHKVGGGFENTNTSGSNYVTYLFGNCPGVSFAGTYAGNGATRVINCGFTSGARFVLIKSYDALSNWLVWDSARGIVAGNDPYLALNSTAAEVTNTDWVDTAATGFELSNAVGNLANTSGRNYIFLAIA